MVKQISKCGVPFPFSRKVQQRMKKKKKKKMGKKAFESFFRFLSNFLIELEKATQAAKYRLGQKKLRVCGYLTVPDKK